MIKLTDTIAKLSNFIALSEEKAKAHCKEHGLTETQMHYLEKIAELDNPTLTELSRELGLSKPTVTVAIDKLVEKGFVTRVRSDKDRRSAHLHLTEAGVELNTIHDVAHVSIAKYITKKMETKEIDDFIRIVGKIVN
jgi:DNA-binding MarR family transcriptional regulator